MNVYVSSFYYAPAFYWMVDNPWVAFRWGWAGNPWYGYYGGYFTPYPVYASLSLWLTDYLVAETLQAAYQERAAELVNAQTHFTPMTSDVKQQIADEVRRQIALETAEARAGAQTAPDPASSGVAPMLSDNTAHVFVVSAGLYVNFWHIIDHLKGEPWPARCSAITEGDVLRLKTRFQSPNTPTATLTVLAAKGQDCQVGATITVGVADLQEMQNHMRETLDLGLEYLQKNQGQNGIPKVPAAAPPVQTAFAAIAPPPDPNVASELNAQTKQADPAEQEAIQAEREAIQAKQKAIQAKRTSLMGQAPDVVIALLGQPMYIVDTTAKKIYVFKYLKVTFTNGKASAVE
jgi:hypothetical protein